MKSRFAFSLIGLALVSMLAGCSAMLPIAGALVLKEAADRYEAANKPAESKPAGTASDEPTVAAVSDDAAPAFEQQAAASPRIAVTSGTSATTDGRVGTAKTSTTIETGALAAIVASHGEEYTEEEIAASRRSFSTPVNRINPSASAALAPAKNGTAPCTPDATAQANEKAQSAVKTASSIPTTKAAASDSATDSAARILATALKQIPNPQATPAAKPAPIIPDKSRND
ncbi:MAG: hypothetical protein KF691_08300 [Phycisphaeraceae bacterium]|nr:hypothetical protein [Phycisphaeraceae bacterium]